MDKTDQDNVYELIVANIIKEQEKIIGPIAYLQAKKVQGIKVEGKTIVFTDESYADKTNVIGDLVNSYSELFGKASIELSKGVVKEMNVSKEFLPDILK